jgi:hypothetical protein
LCAYWEQHIYVTKTNQIITNQTMQSTSAPLGYCPNKYAMCITRSGKSLVHTNVITANALFDVIEKTSS